MSLLALGAVIGAVGSIYTGISAMNSANAVASDMRQQGDILFSESLRTAAIIEEEGRSFGAMQSLQYIGSGVQVAGSALVTIAQTTKYAETEAAAERSKGAAQRDLAYSGAQIKQNQGRASLVSGIIGGASKFLGIMGKDGGTSTVTQAEESGDDAGTFYNAFDEARDTGSVDTLGPTVTPYNRRF